MAGSGLGWVVGVLVESGAGRRVRWSRRRAIQGGGALVGGFALGLGSQNALSSLWKPPALDTHAVVRDTTTTGEPYDLAGSRIVFTSWQMIRPGIFEYVDAAGRAVDLGGMASPGELRMRQIDMPSGIRLVAKPAERRGPILDRDRPWEKAGVNFWSMFRDGGVYRAWGSCTAVSGSLQACYFESADGINWTRPELGLVEFAGSRQNNLLPIPVGSVFKDPSAPPAERYKWVSLQAINRERFERFRAARPDGWEPRAIREEDAGGVMAILGAVSPDGIGWTILPDPLVVEHSDTQIVPYYDRQTETYALYTRNWMVGQTSSKAREPGQSSWQAVGRRSIGRSESADFRRFPVSSVIIDPPLSLQPTDVLYSNARTSVPGAPDHHLLFPSIWHTADDTMTIGMASSYNGRNWNWLTGSPVLGTGEPGTWDAGVVFAHPDLSELKDGRFVLPYTGYPFPHKYPRGQLVFDVGYAAWPNGRLVAVDAPETGQFTTVAFFPPEKRMRINAKTREGGSVLVEIAEITGKPIDGRTFAKCAPIVGDGPALRVRWEGTDMIGANDRQPIIVRIKLTSAELFSIEFV